MGTTSVAKATPRQERPVAAPPLFIISKPEKRVDQSMVAAIAGWYYDPDDHAIYRYWDGQVWTDQCSDVFPTGQAEVTSN